MKKIIKTAKYLTVEVVYRLGVFSLIHFLNRKKITILTTHSIMSESTKSTWIPIRHQLAPEVLDETLGKLKAHYTFLTFEEAVKIIAGELPPVRNGLAITMDDGYENNITHGLPIFQKHGIKPILFVATGHVDEQKNFWFDL